MSKDSKRLINSKYFKWGLTAFLVIVFSILFLFTVYNMNTVSQGVSKVFNVIMPVIIGIVIAYLINPIMRFIEVDLIEKNIEKSGKTITKKAHTRHRVEALVLAFIIISYLVFAFFKSVVPELIYSIRSIISHFDTYYNNVVNLFNSIIANNGILAENDITSFINEHSDDISSFFTESFIPNIKDMLQTVSVGVVSTVGALFDLILGIIIAIYLLLSKEKYIGMVKKMMYALFDREKINNLLVDLRFVNKTFGGFLVGKIIDSIIIGILCYIGLSIMGMPYVMLISVIVGVTNIIPFFGPYLGAIPSAFLILLVNPKMCLYFIIFILVLQQVDGNIIGPAILGNSIGVSSFWIIVSITVFGGFFGVFGMLIGVPLFACFYAFLRRRINNLLIKKKMSIATFRYSSAEYVDENNNIIKMNPDDKGKVKDINNPQYKRYIELNTAEAHQDTTKSDKWYIKAKNAIIEAITKLVAKIKSFFS